MGTKYITAGIVVITLLAGVSTAGAHTLTDALINAYRNSAQLKSEQAALRGTDEGVAQAVAALRPTASGSVTAAQTYSFATGGFTDSASASLSLALTLWDGGNSKLGIDAARLNVAIARDGLVSSEQTVLLNAVTAYMNMRRDAQFLQLAENNRSVIARQVQAARDRYEVGEARRTDVSQAEARLAGAISTVALRQGNLEISRQAYFVATGRYPESLQSPPALPQIPGSFESVKSVALRSHPSVLRAQKLVELATVNVYRAEAAMKPTLSLSGSLSANSSVSGDTASVALTGSVPLSAGGALASAHRQALALEEKSRSDLQLAGLQVTQNAQRYWAQLQIARASITARQKEIRASRVALRGIREEADLGARTTLDVLDAEADLVGAETNLVSAKRDEYVAVYSLLSAMGLLTVKHLRLGIKSYDPETNLNKVSKAPGPTDRKKMLDKIFKRARKN